MQLSRVLFAPLAVAIASLACGSDPVTSPTSVVLSPGATGSALVVAATGGSVKAGDLVLEIPPGALDADTTITVTQLGSPLRATFALQPAGTKFKTPAIAHYTFPPAVLAKLPPDQPVSGIRGLFDDDGTTAEYAPATPDPDSTHLRAPVEHFSTVTFHVVSSESLTPTRLTPSPIQPAVGEEFAVAVSYQRPSDDVVVEWRTRPGGDDAPDPGKVTMAGVSLSATRVSGFAFPSTVVDTSPKPAIGDIAHHEPITPPVELPKAQSSIERGSVFQCVAVGSADVASTLMVHVRGTIVVPNIRLKRTPGPAGDYEIRSLSGQTTLTLDLDFDSSSGTVKVQCTAKTAMMNSLGLSPGERAKIPSRRPARTARSYPDSADKKKHTPTPGTAIGAAQDPLFTVGPGAAARLTTQFPCGDGPSGKTVCGTPGPFAPGDYVMLVSDFDADIPLADPTWRYQHAFVFDADGIAGNNYVPPAQYPKDFFAGSDKWFQLFYEPGKGWSVKVVDARISNSNPVTSAARFVIAGRELAIFIPRAELNGAAPTFRVTTFRHQGDYGLNGGPVDLSYWPLLGEPLVPAVVGSAIVLPE